MTQGESKGQSCLVSLTILVIKILMVGFVLVFLYTGYIYLIGGSGVGPNWALKGYTNEHYRAGEKHGKAQEYEKAIAEFEQAITTGSDNEAMVEECKFHIAECWEKIGDKLESLTLMMTPEADEAKKKQREAYNKAIEIYQQILRENPRDQDAMTRQNLLLMKRG